LTVVVVAGPIAFEYLIVDEAATKIAYTAVKKPLQEIYILLII
jgi:hypothetical protein